MAKEIDCDVNVYPTMDTYQCALMCKGIKEGLIPTTLYKYRSTRRVMEFLGNGQLMFATSDTFNDPYECKLIIDTSIDGKPGKWTETIEQIAKESIENVIWSCGIFSCTTEYDNIPMWAHYADNHQGCCLEFDVTKDLDFFNFPMKVSYDNTYPSCHYFKDGKTDTKEIVMALFHKSEAWSYEHEVRVVKRCFHGLHHLHPKALKSIILGIENKEEQKIMAALSSNPVWSHVQLKRPELSRTSYTMKIVEI